MKFKTTAIIVFVMIVAFLLAATLRSPAAPMTRAEETKAFNALVSSYFESLKQPDNPNVSCCGDGDAYYADKVDRCGPADFKKNSTCALVAIITDTRPDRLVIKKPDGMEKVINRFHLDVGTRIPIPREKLRHRPVPNPLDHNIVFIQNVWGAPWVLCWEPLALI
jgi:hypothetical protein